MNKHDRWVLYMPVFSVFNIRKDNESKDGWIGLLLFEIDTLSAPPLKHALENHLKAMIL